MVYSTYFVEGEHQPATNHSVERANHVNIYTNLYLWVHSLCSKLKLSIDARNSRLIVTVISIQSVMKMSDRGPLSVFWDVYLH